jgi:HemY protein
MRAILLILLLSAAAVGAAWWVEHLTGLVSLQIGATTIQAPLSVGVLALILLVIAIYLVTRVLATIFGLPGAFRRGSERSRRRRGDAAVTSTLVALAAREPADARREAARAARLLGETPQTLLLQAYAGSISGNESEAEEAFQKLAERKDSAFLGLRGLLRLAIAHEEYGRAAELARSAEAAHPGAAWLRGERTQLALRTGDWAEALQLTQEDAPKAGLGAAAAEAETDAARAHKLAKQAWKRNPALPAAAIAYARRLREADREKAAQDVLRKTWTETPTPDLAEFALAPSPDRIARLEAGRALVRGAPDHLESRLLLGRLCLEAGETEEARQHLEAARAQGCDQRRLHLLMGEIAAVQGDSAAEREALGRAATAGPDPAWRCAACGSVTGGWHPACPNCHTAGTVAWAVPAPGTMVLPAARIAEQPPPRPPADRLAAIPFEEDVASDRH